MEKIVTPFTDEQVKKLNEYQQKGQFHPFTCCSSGDEKICERRNGKSEGLLIATNEGFVCPCGQHKQGWAHEFMGV